MRRFWVVFSLLVLTGLMDVWSQGMTVHVLNPWAEDATRDGLIPHIRGADNANHYPGLEMTNSGGNWWSFTFTTTATYDVFFQIVTGIGQNFDNSSYFGINGVSLTEPVNQERFNQFQLIQDFPTSPDIYIYWDGTKVVITDIPPSSKAIFILNPWTVSAPTISLNGGQPETMRLSEHCEWFVYYVHGDSNYNVSFQEIFGSAVYGAAGGGDATPIDLNAHFATYDSAYIYPDPPPQGSPNITSNYPGIDGTCGFNLAATVRDFSVSHPDFVAAGTISGGVVQEGMVDVNLGPDRKPRIGLSPYYQTAFDQWFNTVPGVNAETCRDIHMSKTEGGLWEFDSYNEPSKGYFPIDDFTDIGANERYASNYKVRGTTNYADDPTGGLHNFHFCLELHANFVYKPAAAGKEGQSFIFEGDDDVWVFIDNELMIDLGGVHEAANRSLDLDLVAGFYGWQEGDTLPFDMFFCDRQPTSSNMWIRTSIYFEQDLTSWIDTTQNADGSVRYDVWRRIGADGSCSSTGGDTVVPETSDYLLSGTGIVGNLTLSTSSVPTGISIIPELTAVTIDTTLIRTSNSLAPGNYLLTIRTKNQPVREFKIPFTVYGELGVQFSLPKTPVDTLVGMVVPIEVAATNGVTPIAVARGFTLQIPPGLEVYTDEAKTIPVTSATLLSTDAGTGTLTLWVTGTETATATQTYTLVLLNQNGVQTDTYPNLTFRVPEVLFVDKSPIDTLAGITVPIEVTATNGITPIAVSRNFTLQIQAGLEVYLDEAKTVPVTSATVLTTDALTGRLTLWVTGTPTATGSQTYSLGILSPGTNVSDIHSNLTFRVPDVAFTAKPIIDTLVGVPIPINIGTVFDGAILAESRAFHLTIPTGLTVYQDAGLTLPVASGSPINTDATTGTVELWVVGNVDIPMDNSFPLGLNNAAGTTVDSLSMTFRIPKLRFVDALGNPLVPLPTLNQTDIQMYRVRVQVYTDQWGTCLTSSCADPLTLTSTSSSIGFKGDPTGNDITSIVPVAGVAEFYIYATGPVPLVSFVVQGTSAGTRVEWRSDLIVSYDVKRSWIIDGNQDGQPDSVFIHLNEIVFLLPTGITSVSWPAEGDIDKNGSASNISQVSDSLIVIDFANDPYDFGRTEPIGTPTLTMPDGTTAVIDDEVGPIILTAEIVPPEIKRYILENDPQSLIHTAPDSLRLTLSEPVVQSLNGLGNPWDNLIMIDKQCAGGTPVPMALTGMPVLSAGGSMTVSLPILISGQNSFVETNDCVFLNPNGALVDLKTNKPSPVKTEVHGNSSDFSNFNTSLLQPILGGGTAHTTEIHMPQTGPIAVLNDRGEVVRFIDGGTVTEWIPPLFMDANGNIDKGAQAVCDASRMTDQIPRLFPQNCLSAVGVYSDGAYSAEVVIYDHLGKYIASSTQNFGQCGELENPDRSHPGGFLSFLVWNQRDATGELVGTGVYVWQINYRLNSGPNRTEMFKQGIVRGLGPVDQCAVQ